MSQLLPPYLEIRKALLARRVIPFLGAGASLGRPVPHDQNPAPFTSLPSGNELAADLARRTNFPLGEIPDLTKVAQYYQVIVGRRPLYWYLHEVFDHDWCPMPLHTFLAEIPVPLLIVTTNYDDLIERAFRRKGRPYDLVIHTTDPTDDHLLWWPNNADAPKEVLAKKLVDIDLEAVTVIYKMHGGVDRQQPERDQYVITEDDYIDFLVRMTNGKAIPASFADLFQTRHFLFLGYGLRDWNLRVVLSRIEKDLRRPKGIKSWAIQRQPSPLEQRFWQERGVEVYDLSIEELVNALRSC